MKSRIIECTIDRAKQYENASNAMKRLTIAGFRLYSYLENMAELEDGKSISQLCHADACEYTGLCERAYYAAMKDLTSNGYIKPKAGKRRYYLFDGNGD